MNNNLVIIMNNNLVKNSKELRVMKRNKHNNIIILKNHN